MARENQGLHIALIIFVMLTIGLGVTTYVFFRKYEEATIKTKQQMATADEANKNVAAVVAENNELKRIIGFSASDKLEAITADVKTDMETFAANFDPANRVYRKVLTYLIGVIQQKNASLTAQEAAVLELQGRNAMLEQVKDPQIKAFQTGQETANADLAKQRETFNRDRDSIVGEKSKLQDALEQARKAADLAVAKVQDDLKKTQENLVKMSEIAQKKGETVNKLIKTTFEAPLGKIRWVNQRERTVWINLGQADGLPRQVSFSVYSGDTQNVTGGAKKGSIEVTQILGDHLAEARILDDNISDPLLPGDGIHTPLWTPGEREKFAITDGMDVDGDGKGDPEIIKNLITSSGGRVVAELTDKADRTGQIDSSTRYLIVGKEQTSETPEALIKARSAMLREAEKYSVQTMALPEFLRKMGYLNTTPVTRFGRGANPDQFKAKPPEGVPRSSGGSVSPIFKPRNPPKSSGSAY